MSGLNVASTVVSPGGNVGRKSCGRRSRVTGRRTATRRYSRFCVSTTNSSVTFRCEEGQVTSARRAVNDNRSTASPSHPSSHVSSAISASTSSSTSSTADVWSPGARLQKPGRRCQRVSCRRQALPQCRPRARGAFHRTRLKAMTDTDVKTAQHHRPHHRHGNRRAA